MSRKDALVRLHKSLVEKRDEIRRQLYEDLSEVQSPHDRSGDICDAAMDDSQHELHSQLAAFESRELNQIERAIVLIRSGRYGNCEICQGKIPIARLNALPFTTTCINCQQKQETRGDAVDAESENWDSVFEYEGAHSDKDITIGDLDIDIDLG